MALYSMPELIFVLSIKFCLEIAVIMRESDLKKLISDVQRQKTEGQTLELKSAHGGFPHRIYDTISAFSNQDAGGVLIFGVTDKPDYRVVGVYDAEDVRKKVMESCKQMEPEVRAVTTVCEVQEKVVVAAEIPGVEPPRRPVFYKGVGRVKGSYIRIGDADEPMSEYEVYSYDALRRNTREDLRPAQHVKKKLFDNALLEKYLTELKKERPQLAASVPDEDILELMGIMSGDVPTLAGMMVFSV